MKPYLAKIKTQLKAHLPELKKDFQIKELGIFGSVARGEERSESDVDIIVNFSDPPGFFRFIRLEEHLSNLLHRKVDLVTKNALKEVVKKEILRQVTYV